MNRTNVSNVLVIGSGAAGLRAAIAVHEAGSEVVVVGKRLRKDAHTVLAAGGINAALGTVDPEDSWQQHFADTLKEGYFLSDPRAVEIMAREAPRAIEELVEYGCPFARTETGELDQRFFGAHKYRRTCYAGDYTGRAMLYALADKADSLGIPVHEDRYVSRLLVHDGRCFGAFTFDIHSGERTVYLADAVVLATGGHTRLWRRSSSRRDENTGDGMYLALEAGCRLADMELVQFHPTGMVYPEEWAGTLVTEAVRGEGGRLYNAVGERYMQRYDPGAPRALRPRQGGARELHGDLRGQGNRARRRIPGHLPPRKVLHPGEAAAHVPPVPRSPDAGHLQRADGGGAHGPLLHGRRRRRAGDARHGRGGPLRRRGDHDGVARGQPARGQLALRDDRSSAGAPARRPPRSPCPATYNCAPGRRSRRRTRS